LLRLIHPFFCTAYRYPFTQPLKSYALQCFSTCPNGPVNKSLGRHLR